MKIPAKLIRCSRLEKKTLVERVLKLCEENGELAAEVFKFYGKKNTKSSKAEIQANMEEEAIDCLIMSLDILVRLGVKEDEIDNLMDWKLNKWLDNAAKRRKLKRK